MTDNTEVISILEKAMMECVEGLNMIQTAEVQTSPTQFAFGILVSARQSVTKAKDNIERAISTLQS